MSTLVGHNCLAEGEAARGQREGSEKPQHKTVNALEAMLEHHNPQCRRHQSIDHYLKTT